MNWNYKLIEYWCENYYALREYELLPFESLFILRGVPVSAGSQITQSPYEETCDLNWEFDAALRKLGKEDEALFRQQFIDGTEGEKNSKLCEKFIRILREVSEDAGVC